MYHTFLSPLWFGLYAMMVHRLTADLRTRVYDLTTLEDLGPYSATIQENVV